MGGGVGVGSPVFGFYGDGISSWLDVDPSLVVVRRVGFGGSTIDVDFCGFVGMASDEEFTAALHFGDLVGDVVAGGCDYAVVLDAGSVACFVVLVAMAVKDV